MSAFVRSRIGPAAVAAAIWLVVEPTPVGGQRDSGPVTDNLVRAHMEMLASDALRGRASGSQDEWLAATYVAAEFRRLGLMPLGDAGGFVQRIETPAGGRRGSPGPAQQSPQPTTSAAAANPAVGYTWNVIGQIAGRDADRDGEVILLTAHLDHLGVRGNGPDQIFNGADDDASGVTAVLALASALAAERAPRRTVMFALFGSEEVGLLGARHFLDHPPVPLDRIVANLEFEMLGRPDPAVAPGTLWLTGFERTNLGPTLASRGARIVADPHPAQNFFSRSDNIQLAYRGIVAQTISSFGLHPQYHTASDDLAHIDFAHLTAAIQSLVRPIRWLADSRFTPEWREGMRPVPRGGGR